MKRKISEAQKIKIKNDLKNKIDTIIMDVFKDDPSPESIEATLRWLHTRRDYTYRTLFDVLMEKYEVTSQWYYEELANKISMDFWLKNMAI